MTILLIFLIFLRSIFIFHIPSSKFVVSSANKFTHTCSKLWPISIKYKIKSKTELWDTPYMTDLSLEQISLKHVFFFKEVRKIALKPHQLFVLHTIAHHFFNRISRSIRPNSRLKSKKTVISNLPSARVRSANNLKTFHTNEHPSTEIHLKYLFL